MINRDLEAHFESLIQQEKIRSAGYCIAKNGKVVSCHAIGDMDLGNGAKKEVRTDTLFETQSITKWITAVLKQGLFYEPGSRWEYSMIGFCILGEIIARITGERAEDFIRREILLPCQMTETHWKREITPDRAKRYQVRTGRHRQQYAAAQLSGAEAWIDYCAGWKEIPETAGGLMSTLTDLIRFGILLSEGGSYGGRQILQESSLHLFEENQLAPGVRDFCWDHGGRLIAYGAGCPTYDSSIDRTLHVGKHTIYHEGAGPCVLMVNRKEGLAAVWDAPFFSEDKWCAEPIYDTADIIWNTR